ncbi:MAG: hypothetical protein Q4C68_04220 [Moraxella sp.]|nr:hypothetical protein [Moraxella sp.]
MTTKLKSYAIAAVLAFAPLAYIQPAQAYFISPDNYFATWQIDNAFQRNLWENQEKYGTGYKGAKKSAQKSATQKTSGQKTTSKTTTTNTNKTNSSAHRYTPSSSVSSQVNTQMIQAMRADLQASGKLNSQTEKELNALSKANLVGQVKNALKSDGYEPNSLATAMGYWVVVNYGISQRQDLSKLKAHALVKQLQDSIGSTDLSSLSNNEKQVMAETLYWAGSLHMAMYLEATQTNNRQYITQSVNVANQALSKMGISASQIKQGSNGLEFR